MRRYCNVYYICSHCTVLLATAGSQGNGVLSYQLSALDSGSFEANGCWRNPDFGFVRSTES
jgi:hypothetical protein